MIEKQLLKHNEQRIKVYWFHDSRLYKFLNRVLIKICVHEIT